MPLLEVDHLHVRLQTHRGPAYAVRDVGFSLEPGATLGLVGESGCGKSMTVMALMGLLPENAEISGSIRFEGQELIGKSDSDMCRIRGDRIGMIFQEPMTALNPVHSIGRQVAEPLRLHRGLSAAQARKEALALLDRVGIPDAARRIDAFPHQFSGGQRQRITIAMALACGPDLLIADEPTTALDVTIQRQILDLISELVAERGMALILISHDLGVIAQNVARMMVMYGGSVVESGPDGVGVRTPSASVLAGPVRSPARAGVAQGPATGDHCRIGSRTGRSADGVSLRGPMRFHHRAMPCHGAACDRGGAGPPGPVHPARCGGCSQAAGGRRMTAGAPLLQVENLVREYTMPRDKLFGPQPRVHAVNGVSFTVEAGRSLGIVGESGSGKSTIARLVMALDRPTSGRVMLLGRDLHTLPREALRQARRDIQMVFQDPYGSLDPRQTIERIVTEPLAAQGDTGRDEQRRRAEAVVVSVGLRPNDLGKYPHEFSGGQRQRIAIARALITRPRLIVADEPVSALDVSVQAQVLNLMQDLQTEFGITYMLISHDLAVVRHLCDDVAVLWQGRIVEQGPPERLFQAPEHPYTRALLEAVPKPEPGQRPRPAPAQQIPLAMADPSRG